MPIPNCDSNLNLKKCFENTPPSTLPITDLTPLHEDWLNDFEALCRTVKPNLAKNFFYKHIGDRSGYKSKKFLTEQLAFIYRQLSAHRNSALGKVDSKSCNSSILELTEDIQECTEGFHIRVNKLINSLNTPENLDQLLYLVRKGIIEEMASGLMIEVSKAYQVHVADRVIRIAKKLKIGIEPNIQKDPYKSLLPRKKITQVIEEEFPKRYRPLKIPFLLADQLNLILNQYGYVGAQPDGYATGPAETIYKKINGFFTESAPANITEINQLSPMFILDQIDEFKQPTRIYDVNWDHIRSLFLKKLIDEGYLIEEPKPISLIEYAYYQTLLPEKANSHTENQWINAYLESQNYAKLLDDLHFIQTTFSVYWQTLTKNPLLVENTEKFFEFLKSQSSDLNSPESSKRLSLVYILFFSQTKAFILSKIVNPTQFNLNIINNHLFFQSMRYFPDIIKELLDISVNQYADQPRIFFNLLFKVNHVDENLLMLAARHHVQTLHCLLSLINQHKENFEKAEIAALFLSHNTAGWNLLSLAAKYHSEAIDAIFNFINENSDFFDFETTKLLFNQKINHRWCFLQFLIRFGAASQINRCLDFISAKINPAVESIENKEWRGLILNTALTGSVLRIATKFNQSALQALLTFIGNHSKHLDASLLPAFFLEKNEIDWNCLHTAAGKKAEENTTELELILAFISKHIEQFSGPSLQVLFLAENKDQVNFLQLTAFNRPASLNTIFEFFNQHPSRFDKKIFQALLQHKAINGWNSLSFAYPHPISVKSILGFIETHPNSFPKEIIKEIILQESTQGYTSLHVMAKTQPDSLKVLLDFISEKIKLELFTNDFNFLFESPSQFQRINRFFKKPPSKTNLLALSTKYQPESAKHFSNFLNTHANSFNLKKPFLKNFIDKTANDTVVIDTQLAPTT